MVVHRWRQSQVEEPLGVVSARERRQVGVESGKRADVIIRALEVRIFTEKGSETLTLLIRDLKVTEQPFFSRQQKGSAGLLTKTRVTPKSLMQLRTTQDLNSFRKSFYCERPSIVDSHF